MRILGRSICCALVSSLAFAAPTSARLDEGMWTFDNPPSEKLEEVHGFDLAAEWLDHVRLSSVRLNDGGSGSIVSPKGLILTNHHVGFNAIQKLSSEENDYIANGFYAASRAEELSCTDLEINVLESIADVTDRVHGAVDADADEATAREQEEEEIARIEKEETEATGLRCDVIKLYAGGKYALYRLKKYTDVRLVFAPEKQAAFFGGDPDNFNFPRYALDMAVFRVYEGGEPAETPHYLRWNRGGPDDGDLVFVSGNPGSTGRMNTLAQMEYLRDHHYPRIMNHLGARHGVLQDYAKLGEEQERRALMQVFGVENSIKALGGYLTSLREARSIATKSEEEAALREHVASDPALAAEVGTAWDEIAEAQQIAQEIGDRYFYSNIRGSRLFRIARHLVRLSAELEKPNGERLPEYRDSALDSLKLSLFSEAPIYPDLEHAGIQGALNEALEHLGPDDPFVRAALAVAQPVEAAASITETTQLVDVDHRKSLLEGGRDAVAASKDPMIQLALRVDPICRELRETMENRVRSVERASGKEIARARFAAHGTSIYPDATFSLRLSYGTVKGFDAGGYKVPYKTTFNGLFERSASFDNEPPYDLPATWAERRSALDPSTPYNFVCTADIIGGNSGSPVLNREGELVGLIFDGNIQSLGNRFVYDDSVARAVAVHSAGMLEAMRVVYRADELVEEILAASFN